jgi:carbon monoxide dehydrogenase subunit G
MQIENSFQVEAPPERVFAFVLDVNQVVGCVPGAELTEVVDGDTFKGRVKIKVGPITVAYSGTARIVGRDEAAHTADLEAEGRETTGPGSAKAKARMAVEADGSGSVVKVTTEFTVAGRVAQFGRGVMEDVSRRLIGQMADCIKARLQAAPADEPTPVAATAEGEATTGGEAASRLAATTTAPAPAKPVNALSLFFAVLWARIKGLFGGRRAKSGLE